MPFKKVYPQERFSNCWKLHNENETVRYIGEHAEDNASDEREMKA